MLEDSSTDAYRNLQQFIDRQPEGFPKTESLADTENLIFMFTPEQAEVEIHMKFVPEPAGVIAARCGKPMEEVKKILESMVLDGLILRVLSKGITCYMVRNLWSVFWETGSRTTESGKDKKSSHVYA